MRKRTVTFVLAAAMAVSSALPVYASEETDSAGDLSGKTFAIVIRNAGNPYAEKEAEGFREVIEAAGAECIVRTPERATADAQIPLIQSLISQEVDAIAIASNDVNALTASLTEAMIAGIKETSLTSNVAPGTRRTSVNQ